MAVLPIDCGSGFSYFVCMQFKQKLLLAFTSLFALFFTGCVSTYVHKFRMTASEAPEVHGANTYQMPHSSSWRITGKVNANQRKDMDVTNESSVYKDLNHLFDSYEGFSSATYTMGGIDFTGKMDYLYKIDNLILGMGVGYKDGIYHHFTLGFNFLNFEFGGFIGGFHQYSDLEYDGKTCNDEWYYDDDECRYFADHHYRFNSSIMGGMFAGVYFEKLFFNYSLSVYRPRPEIESYDNYDLDVPQIATSYLTTGYRFNRWIEFSVGGIATYVEGSDWNLGFTSGISLYLK